MCYKLHPMICGLNAVHSVLYTVVLRTPSTQRNMPRLGRLMAQVEKTKPRKSETYTSSTMAYVQFTICKAI